MSADDEYHDFRPEVLIGLEPTRKRPTGCFVPETDRRAVRVEDLTDEEAEMILDALSEPLPDDL